MTFLSFFQTSDELKHANEQIGQNEDQKAKAERVIKRLKADYDARIAVRFTEYHHFVFLILI